MVGDVGNDLQPAPIAFYHLGFREGGSGIVAALDINIRSHKMDQVDGVVLTK